MEKTNLNSTQFLDNPELLTRSEVAQLLHVSLSYIDHLTDLPCYKLGKKKLFSRAEVFEYLSKNHQVPKSRIISKTDSINIKKEVMHD